MRSKSILVFAATLLVAPVAAVAADSPAAAPPPVDPVTAALTSILTPVGNAANIVVQPVLVAPINAVTPILAPAPPPPPPAPMPKHHRHHRHHKAS